MARGVHCINPISSQSLMLIEHYSSYLTKGTIFPLNHTILTSDIG
jgi:hypothetical protein